MPVDLTPDQFLEEERAQSGELTPESFLAGEAKARKPEPVIPGTGGLTELPGPPEPPLPAALDTRAPAQRPRRIGTVDIRAEETPAPTPPIVTSIPKTPKALKPALGILPKDRQEQLGGNFGPDPLDQAADAIKDYVDNTILKPVLGAGTGKITSSVREQALAPMNPHFQEWVSPDAKGPMRAVRGVLGVVDQVLAPENQLLALGTGALGAAGRIGQGIERGMEAYFGASAAAHSAESLAASVDAFKNGDYDTGWEHLGFGTGEGVLGALLVRASLRGLPEVAKDAEDALRARRSLRPSSPEGQPGGGDYNVRGTDYSTRGRPTRWIRRGKGGSYETGTGTPPPGAEVIQPEGFPPSFPDTTPTGSPGEPPAPREGGGGGAGAETPSDGSPGSNPPRHFQTIEIRNPDGTVSQLQVEVSETVPTPLLDSIIDAMDRGESTAQGEPRGPSSLLDQIADTDAQSKTGTGIHDDALMRELLRGQQRPGLLDSMVEEAPPIERGGSRTVVQDGTELTPDRFLQEETQGTEGTQPVAEQPQPGPLPAAAAPPAAPPIAAHTTEQPEPFPTGDTAKVKTARGTEATVRYAWIPRGDLVGSHDALGNPNSEFPAQLQPRDRTRAGSQAQIAEIAGKLDPEQTGANPAADRGAIIVARMGDRYVVISGNGRKAAFDQLAGAQHANWDRYQQYWIDHAEDVGVNPEDVRANPDGVLARLLIPKGSLDLAKFATEANEDDKAAMSATETAKADAARLTPGLMAAFTATETGDILHPANREFLRKFFGEVVSPGEAKGLMTADGEISQAGINRVRNAIFAYAYGADTTALEKLAESPDSNIRNVTAGMLIAAPKFAKARDGIQQGELYPVDLTPHLSAAVAKIAELRERGQTVPDYLAQIGLFGEEMTDAGKAILAAFHEYRRSPKKIGALLAKFADILEAAGSPKQTTMWGGGEPTLDDVLAAAIEAAEKENGKPKEADSGPSLFEEGEPAAGPATPAPGREEPGEKGPPAQEGGEPVKPEPKPEGPAAGGAGDRKTGKEPRQPAQPAPAGGKRPAPVPPKVEPQQPAPAPEEPAAPEASAPATPAEAGAAPQGLTVAEKQFLDACLLTLETGEGINNNLALAALANESFGGQRHAGAWDIKQVYDLLEGAIAKYIGSQPWLLSDPADVLRTLRNVVMAVLPTQADRTEGQLAFQQFSTPPTIALLAAFAAGLGATDTVMEPSAGTAMLAVWAKVWGSNVLTNEIDPRRRAILEYLGFGPTAVDAEQLHNLTDAHPDVVLMNPPFSAAGNRGITKDQGVWKRHVEQALLTLKPGGRLVAILPGGRHGAWEEGASMNGSAAGWWDKILAEHNVRANLLIPGKEYGKYGTTYDVRLVVIDKTGPTPGTNALEKRANVVQTPIGSLEEAFNAIRPIANDRPASSGNAPGSGTGSVEPRPGGGRKPSPTGSGSAPSGPRPSGRRPGKSAPGGVPEPLAPREPVAPAGEPAAGSVPDSGGAAEAGEPRKSVTHQAPAVELGANVAADAPREVGGGTFVTYQPAKLKGGAPHPAPIIQTASLAATEPPDISYYPKFDPAIVEDGRISNVQLEAVCYAGQRHEKILPNGQRAGIFIGDGTGVGKGREIAAIIADNWAQGRKRAVWVSVSTDLIESARRDLADLGLDIPIRIVNDWKATKDIDLNEGIVFSTYASLIGEGKDGDDQNAAVSKRIDQLAKWTGNDGLLVFDEAHKAKNAWDSGTGEPTATGLAVLKIQNDIPLARVVYASATGATEVRNMAYMTRLGLWGDGTAFKDFVSFMSRVDSGGVGAMEMVARDLKARGAYMARTISFAGDTPEETVTYRERIHELTAEQRRMYDTACEAWLSVIERMEDAINVTHAPGRARARAMSLFWSAHQRFFKQLVTAFKVPSAIKEIQAALDKQQSVVISVMTTGEAQQNRMVQAINEQGGALEDMDWTPRELLDRLIVQVFPIHAYEEFTDPQTGRKAIRPVYEKNPDGTNKLGPDGKPIHVIDKQALAMREALRDSLSTIALPGNPIDLLIEHFGEDQVAELTGRKQRIGVNAVTGKKELKKRKVQGVAQSKTNLAEVDAFQDGSKRIALISDAASTGISLHADRRAKNQQRRVHIALELKWSADKQLQDFGRTHRSNQVSAPEYVLMSVGIGGEKRFSATIARRLASLGALTQGSRDATSGGEIAKYNFESEYGSQAVTTLLTQMRQTPEGRETLAKMGLIKRDPNTREPRPDTLRDTDLGNVPRFLNRVLSLPVAEQNALFDRFVALFSGAIETAKRQGTFDDGVADLKGAIAIREIKRELVPTSDPEVKTWHVAFEVDEPTHPVSWADVLQRRSFAQLDRKARQPGFFKQAKSGHVVLMASSGTRSDPKSGRSWNTVSLVRPNGSHEYLSEEDFDQKYQPVAEATAREWWEEKLKSVPKIHTREVHLIAGALLNVWGNIEKAGAAGMNVLRVQPDKAPRVVGVQIPNQAVGEVLKALGIGRELVRPDQIHQAVLEQGEEITLAGGYSLRRTKVHGDTAIEIVYPQGEFAALRGTPGLIEERILGKLRFFVPTDAAKGVPAIAKLIERFPVMGSATGAQFAAAPKGWDAIEGRSAEQMAAAIRFVYRRGTLYVNQEAIAAIGAAWQKSPSGIMLQRPAIRVAIESLTRQASGLGRTPGARKLRLLAHTLRKAGENQARIVVADASQTPSRVKAILRHERAHERQAELGAHLWMYTRDFLAHPLAGKAIAALAARGYTEQQSYDREIAAFLIGGPAMWQEYLKLTYDEGIELFDFYLEMLNRAHGPRVAFAIERIHPTLIARIHAAQAAATPDRGRTPQAGTRAQETGNSETGARKTLSAPQFALRAPEVITQTRDEIRKQIFPTARAESAERAANSLRQHAAEAARSYAQAEHALKLARAQFGRMSWAENLDFINRVEANERQPDEKLQRVADTIRTLLDDARDDVQGLGTGKLQSFYETYFPHIWKKAAEAEMVFKRVFAKKPIEGPKSFLKKRKYETFAAGVEAGLEPVSENAIDLVLLKLQEMYRYLLAHHFLNEMKRSGLARYVPVLKIRKAPEGWSQIPDPIGTVWGPPHIQVKEAVDEEVWNGLTRLAEHLGIDHRRVATMRGGRWGFAVPAADRVVTRYAGPESVLIHEIGHILDTRYGLGANLVNAAAYKQELRELADLRISPDDSDSQRKYYRNAREKIANMVALYIHNRRRFREIAPATFRYFDNFVRSRPELEELASIEYGMQLKTMRRRYPVGGLILRGYYYMPAEAAHIVKNFLSPGLGRFAWYRGARGFSNFLLQFQLGFSAFHLGFTSYDAAVSRFSLALEYLATGKPVMAAAKAVSSLWAPITNPIKGHSVYKAYLEGVIADPELAEYVRSLVEAGGRVKMDEFYRTKARERFVEAWRKTDVGGMLWNALPGLSEAVMWPILEWLVPRQKLGVFADLARFELERLRPDAGLEERRAAFAKAWDSVDNRMGQLVYDNLFWNKAVKDLAMISVRSLGWNLGTFRELPGGYADWARFARDTAKYGAYRIRGGGGDRGGIFGGGGGGRPPVAPPKVTHRMAYTLALPLFTAIVGATWTYLATGKGPEDEKDYFFPRTGGFDEAGHPERVSLPGYMKDQVHWWIHPVQAARNKLNPLFTMLGEMLQNEDYWGREIYNRNDPVVKVALDLARHVAKGFVPYAAGNLKRERERGASPAMQAAPFIGITAAPAYIDQTPAQRLMQEFLAEGHKGSLTQAAAERIQARRELASKLRRHDPEAREMAIAALREGKLTAGDVRKAAAGAAKNPDLARYKLLPVEQALEVYRAANDTERRQFRLVALQKLAAKLRNAGAAEKKQLIERYRDVVELLRRKAA